MLRLTVSWPASLGVKPPFRTQNQILITFRVLWVCWCGEPSLTRGRGCRLQLLLVLASAVIFVSGSRGTHDHILLSQVRDSPNLEGRIPVFPSPETGWPSYTPRHWVPFRRLLRLAGLRWRYSTPPASGVFREDLLPNFPFIRHGPHRKRRLQHFFVAVETCLPIRCRATVGGIHI
jgi:hypothetical protein